MKILLLQLKRIGDLVLTTPAVAALRERFPLAQVTMVVSSECADLLPAISGLDRILMARRNLRDLAPFLAVAGKRFDYCIDFTRNDRSAFLTLLSRARKRIVSYRVRDQSKSRARLYTDFVDVCMRDLHTIDYNLALTITGPRGNGATFGGNGSVSGSADIWNGIGGFRGHVKVGDWGLFVPFYFDAGAGGSRLTWQISSGIGYHASWADLSLTYRYLTFQQGSGVVDHLSVRGPLLMASFPF